MPVHYELIGDSAVVTIANPATRNAIDLETARSLGEAWRRFESDDDALVGILTGSGGNFSSGADLKAMDLEDGPDGFLGMTRMSVSKPTIAAVAGYCVAGGLELALWCDLRVAGEDVVFGCLERRYGVPLIDGGTVRLPRVVGLSRALDLIMTGRTVDGAEALRIGLADRLVAPDTELASALDLAAEIAAHPQAALRSDRASVYDSLGLSIADALERERELGLRSLEDVADGAERFRKGER